MDKIKAAEKKIIIVELYIVAVAIMYVFFALKSTYKSSQYLVAVTILAAILLLKLWLNSRSLKHTMTLFSVLKAMDLVFISIFSFIEDYNMPSTILYLVIILSSAWLMGIKMGYIMLIASIVAYFIAFLLGHIARPDMFAAIIQAILYMGLFILISVSILRFIKKHKDEYDELKKSNEKLSKTVAEFYMLQQVDNAMNCIYDPDKLLFTVNDVILGVIGAAFSSILLLKEDETALEIKTSNIESEHRKALLQADGEVLWSCMDAYGSILKNDQKNQGFILNDTAINSFICVPIIIRDKRCGMILVEHERADALTDDHLRLLENIAGNLSAALETSILYQKMRQMAILDGLTQVHNRMYFQQVFEEELEKAKGNYPLSLAIGDIDHFKEVNDVYGHIAGDKILMAVTDVIKRHLRQNDVIARYGGEEFVIILPGVDMHQAYSIIERLRERIGELEVIEEGHTISVTISFGIASYPECGWTTGQLLRNADKALYEAKNIGRNCVRIAAQEEGKINTP